MSRPGKGQFQVLAGTRCTDVGRIDITTQRVVDLGRNHQAEQSMDIVHPVHQAGRIIDIRQ